MGVSTNDMFAVFEKQTTLDIIEQAIKKEQYILYERNGDAIKIENECSAIDAYAKIQVSKSQWVCFVSNKKIDCGVGLAQSNADSDIEKKIVARGEFTAYYTGNFDCLKFVEIVSMNKSNVSEWDFSKAISDQITLILKEVFKIYAQKGVNMLDDIEEEVAEKIYHRYMNSQLYQAGIDIIDIKMMIHESDETSMLAQLRNLNKKQG